LCASVPSAPYLDPCIWGTQMRAAVVASVPASASLVLTKGVFLRVRVNDPSGLLPRGAQGPFPAGNRLLVGAVWGSAGYLSNPTIVTDGRGRDYQMPVPVGVPLTLRLFSRELALTDAAGVASTLVPFRADTGQDQMFTYTISRVQAQ